MSRLLSLDKVYHFTDPKLIAIDSLLNTSTPKKPKLAPKCQLLSTASKFIQESRRKDQPPSPNPASSTHNDDNRSISSNNSKIRHKKKKRPNHDISEVMSVEYRDGELGVVLEENYSEQPGVVLRYLMKRDPGGHVSPYEKEILKGWIMCLDREDRMEVEKERTWFPNPRNIELRHIDAGLNQIYGVGPKRRLRPGEEASLIQSIEKFLDECNKNPSQIAMRQSTIHDTILSWAELEDLVKYPFCMKQLQCHFKIMATRWRFSGKLNLTNKNVEKAVYTAQSRGHFLDLTKTDHTLVKYLLKHSKYIDAIHQQPRRRHTIAEQSRHHTTDHDGSRL